MYEVDIAALVAVHLRSGEIELDQVAQALLHVEGAGLGMQFLDQGFDFALGLIDMADDDVALGDQDEELAQGFEQLQEDFFAGGIAVDILAVGAGEHADDALGEEFDQCGFEPGFRQVAQRIVEGR